MGAPSVITKTDTIRQIKYVEVLNNKFAMLQYDKIKITKSGYLWGYLQIAFADSKLVPEIICYVGAKGFKIESINDQGTVTLKKPKQGLQLHDTFVQDKETRTWQKEQKKKSR